MTINDTVKKGDSQCRSCKRVFNHSDLKIVQVKHYGLEKEEKVCPYCGSYTYGMIDYPVSEEELIYGRRSYRNSIHIRENERKSKLLKDYELNDEQELEFYINGYMIGKMHG